VDPEEVVVSEEPHVEAEEASEEAAEVFIII